jgi:transposase
LLRQSIKKSAGVHDDTTLLVGLEGVVVDRVELDPDGCRVVHVSTAPPAQDTGAVCPSCQTPATSVKGWVTTRPRDVALPVPARLVWHKRRWRCRQSGCVRSSFTESIPQVPSGARITSRLRDAAGAAVAVGGRTIAAVGRDLGVSWPVVSAAFVARATTMLAAEPEPVEALGIDETRRGRPRFALDPETGVLEQVTDRWHTGFTDLTGQQGLLGQVEGRSSSDAGGLAGGADPDLA